MASPKLISRLLSEGNVSESDIRAARKLQTETGGQLLDVLVRIGAIDEEVLLDCAASAWGIDRLGDGDMPAQALDLISAAEDLGLAFAWLETRQAQVWWANGSDYQALNVAACNPVDPVLQEQIGRAVADRTARLSLSRPDVRWFLSSRSQLDALASMVGETEAQAGEFEADGDLSRLRELAEEAPIIDLVNQIFSAAIKHGASDIHIEPSERFFDVRLRIDGVVQTWQRQPATKFDAVSTRIKLISSMDIAERRLPQDGRQSIRLSGQTFDLRVSSLPGAWGESLVLRLLPKNKSLPSLQDLGLSGRALGEWTSALNQPNGIVLVTGPTGSGKSTTLYTGLQSINDGSKKIITIEDPIEFNMDRVTQVQVKADIGLTFAAGLRSILRQDPDVIMIGEIRDPETARIAIQSALTGHLVLSTLHTNSALLAIPRLLDLGLEAFQIGAAVKALAAQRLVRQICRHCSEPAERPEQFDILLRACDRREVDRMAPMIQAAEWRKGVGCPACAGTGYSGRKALFEIVRIDQAVKTAVLEEAGSHLVEEAARKQGYRRLAEDGLEKAILGVTTVSEVLRVVSEDAMSEIDLEPVAGGA